MPLRLPRFIHVVGLVVGLSADITAAEESAAKPTPQPRPRLTDAHRAQTERAAPAPQNPSVMTMDRVVVRESPLPSGPWKVQPLIEKFSLTQGGYLLKNRGKSFSTEVGLWRHIDIMEDPAVALRQSPRIRMGILRFSW